MTVIAVSLFVIAFHPLLIPEPVNAFDATKPSTVQQQVFIGSDKVSRSLDKIAEAIRTHK